MNLDRRLISFLRAVPLTFAVTIFLGTVAGLMILFQASTLSQIITRVFLMGQNRGEIQSLFYLFLLFAGLRAGFTLLYEVNSKALAVRLKTRLREILFERILGLGPVSIRNERTGELTATVVQGIEELDAWFSQYLPQLWLAVLIPVLILIYVLPMDFLTGVVLLLTAPLIPIFMILIGKTAESLTCKQWMLLARMSSYFLDSLRGIVTLKMLNQSANRAQKVEDIGERYRQTTLKVLRVTFLSALVLEMVGTLSIAIVAVEIGLRLLYGQMQFQQAFFILVVAPEFYLPLRLLGQRFHAGMAGIAAAKKIFEVLDSEKPFLISKNDEITKAVLTPALERFDLKDIELTFDNVSYTYPGSDHPAIHTVTFSIKSGQHTALVGVSGAGKSTIAQLMMRLIEPTEGKILLSGKSLQVLPAAEWRSQIAWVPQFPYFFHDTLAANIGLAGWEENIEKVQEAARQANLHEWIQSLPEGYSTQVGELGRRLSGGQAQRLALARAFFKNSPLIVMDEPGAHMDPDLDWQLQLIIRRLASTRTVVTIAHRLATIFQADQIIFLEQGRIMEIGKHGDLMRQRGRYFQLVENFMGGDDNL
jgi:ATP-binding cassette, subfamily C, bacterial CydD